MNVQRGTLVSGGRLEVPADILRALAIKDGDPVTMRVVDGELHVRPLRDVVQRVQARFRAHLREGSGIVDEFLAERRAEAGRE